MQKATGKNWAGFPPFPLWTGPDQEDDQNPISAVPSGSKVYATFTRRHPSPGLFAAAAGQFGEEKRGRGSDASRGAAFSLCGFPPGGPSPPRPPPRARLLPPGRPRRGGTTATPSGGSGAARRPRAGAAERWLPTNSSGPVGWASGFKNEHRDLNPQEREEDTVHRSATEERVCPESPPPPLGPYRRHNNETSCDFPSPPAAEMTSPVAVGQSRAAQAVEVFPSQQPYFWQHPAVCYLTHRRAIPAPRQSCCVPRDQAGQGIQPDTVQQSVCKKEGAKVIKTGWLLVSPVHKTGSAQGRCWALKDSLVKQKLLASICMNALC